ncbi:MAG: adenylate/guanylate cyclase domain-containing protein [Nitrospiraceae bacterium]|jgi:adenylate cyclase|nr:MAG: adenylate/guanylate cyclase domain-containing protein [Nitrospiraceae bacterium]
MLNLPIEGKQRFCEMSRLAKSIIFGIIIGVTGVMISFVPFSLDVEENIGLNVLFNLRGSRNAPPEVVVVGIDRESSDALNLPGDPRKWPRSLHARLVNNLISAGAAVIAFDMTFEDPGPADEDRVFAEAVRKAGNVVLSSTLKGETVSLTGREGSPTHDVTIVKMVPPVPPLEESAAALAPFPLPKVPVKVSQYWTFGSAAGDTPTIPVVAFDIFVTQTCRDFLYLLKVFTATDGYNLSLEKDDISEDRGVEKVIRRTREFFISKPRAAERMLQALDNSGAAPQKELLLTSLIKIYQGMNSRYLNFYGPPRSITTIPYYQILQLDEKALERRQIDLKGKAVFIGRSEYLQSAQKDGYYTVFSQSDGLDISGVEIMATAFANLIEDVPVRPVGFYAHVMILFLWGMTIGIVCRQVPPGIAAASLIGMSILYLAFAGYAFSAAGIWVPVVLPLFFQTAIVFFGGVLWKYMDSNKERDNIRKAFEYYMPDQVVDQVVKNIGNLQDSNQVVYGICLCTDAEHYTSLSETMDPRTLGTFMNTYFEAVFQPVRNHGGIVSNVVGDSMLAVWVATQPEPRLKQASCLAALDVSKAIQDFTWSCEKVCLPTRIGLHSGHILLGNIGAIDHYEYRPVGDIVNTAARIEGLNKFLGTKILVSEELIKQLDGFLTREIGKFLLVGKTKALTIYELIGRREDCSELQSTACALFADAVDTFRWQSWDKAESIFQEVIRFSGKDGPSRFYLDLCGHYRAHPPGESWDGVVRMDHK